MIQLPLFNEKPPVKVPEDIKTVLEYTDSEIIVAFSGGKDSVAMVLYLFDLGVCPSRIGLHHHDVDGDGGNLWDWPCTPSYCEAFAEAFGLPIVFSWRKGGITREIFRENEGLQDVEFINEGSVVRLKSKPGDTTKRRFPAVSKSLSTRWCSSVVKIDVMSRVLCSLYPSSGLHDILVLTGERREESPNRAKYKEFEPYRANTKTRNAVQWRPVLDFSESEVWELFQRYRVQPHPCYELGWNRCSCQTCIYSSPNTWASIADIAPEKIIEFDKIEKEIGFTLYNGMTISEKVAKGKSFVKKENRERWAEESMSVFVSPIIIDNWKLPQGAGGTESAGAI